MYNQDNIKHLKSVFNNLFLADENFYKSLKNTEPIIADSYDNYNLNIEKINLNDLNFINLFLQQKVFEYKNLLNEVFYNNFILKSVYIDLYHIENERKNLRSAFILLELHFISYF